MRQAEANTAHHWFQNGKTVDQDRLLSSTEHPTRGPQPHTAPVKMREYDNRTLTTSTVRRTIDKGNRQIQVGTDRLLQLARQQLRVGDVVKLDIFVRTARGHPACFAPGAESKECSLITVRVPSRKTRWALGHHEGCTAARRCNLESPSIGRY